MYTDDDCPHCKNDAERKKTCDECAGSGKAVGAYTVFQPTPKQNGWNFQHIIEFIIALVFLVIALVATALNWSWRKIRRSA